MAFRTAILRIAGGGTKCCALVHKRWAHVIAQPPPLDSAISRPAALSPLVLPEFDRSTEIIRAGIGLEFPSFNSGSGSMELMAVPKKKTSPHKRGIRNGPKALKPIPVIIRCKACGRVKLPHFFCCSGLRVNPDGQNGSTS